MGFFTSKKKEIVRTEPVVQTKSLPQEPSISISFFPGLSGSTTASGVTITQTTVMELSAAYACINLITTDIGKLPISVEQRQTNGGWKALYDHRYNFLLKKPNKRNSKTTFLQNIVLNYLVSGNAYVVIIRDKSGSPTKLIPIDSSMCTVTEQMNGDRYYRVTCKLLCDEITSIKGEKGQTRTIIEEDMIHILNLNRNNDLMGESIIQLAGEVFGLGLAAQQTAARAYNNGASMTGYLKVNGHTNKQTSQKMQEDWNRATQSITNAGSIPVLPADVDFIKTESSPAELQLIESREQIAKEIARIFKVPLHKLGFNETDKAANIEQQERSYVSNALEPITTQLEEQFELKVLFESEINKLRIKFDFSEMILPDKIEQYQASAIGLTNGFLNKDEVRESIGKPPLPNGEGQDFFSPTYTALHTGEGSINIDDKT